MAVAIWPCVWEGQKGSSWRSPRPISISSSRRLRLIRTDATPARPHPTWRAGAVRRHQSRTPVLRHRPPFRWLLEPLLETPLRLGACAAPADLRGGCAPAGVGLRPHKYGCAAQRRHGRTGSRRISSRPSPAPRQDQTGSTESGGARRRDGLSIAVFVQRDGPAWPATRKARRGTGLRVPEPQRPQRELLLPADACGVPSVKKLPEESTNSLSP